MALTFVSGRISRSCQPLLYIRRWISRKPLEIGAWLIQRTTNRKWHMGYQMVTWRRDVTPKVLRGSTVGFLATAWLLVMFTDACNNHKSLVTAETDELTHISAITRVWHWRFPKNIAYFRYRDSIEYRDTWDGIVIVAAISGIAQH